jgi:hypothetical protein
MTTRLAAVVIGIVFASAAPAAEVAGVKLDDKVKIAPNAPELVLNGAGVRTRVIVKVYVGALYLPEKKTTATEVLALPGAKRITLAMLRDLTAQQLSEALTKGSRRTTRPPSRSATRPSLPSCSGS